MMNMIINWFICRTDRFLSLAARHLGPVTIIVSDGEASNQEGQTDDDELFHIAGIYGLDE